MMKRETANELSGRPLIVKAGDRYWVERKAADKAKLNQKHSRYNKNNKEAQQQRQTDEKASMLDINDNKTKQNRHRPPQIT